jgi:hypothetical protein
MLKKITFIAAISAGILVRNLQYTRTQRKQKHLLYSNLTVTGNFATVSPDNEWQSAGE